MFCRKCGTENEDQAVFCKECGARLVLGPSLESQIKKLVKRIASLPKKYKVGAGIGIAAVVVILIVVANLNSTINLNNYVTVTFEGYDGYGKATATIDWNKILDKYKKKISYTSKAKSKYEYALFGYSMEELLGNCVSVSLEKEDGLSNGDRVKYVWNIDENQLKKYVDCKIKYSDETVDVSGLEKIKTFDPFENLTLTYSGISPNGTVAISYTGDVLDEDEFYCDTDSGLSNGDVITVYLNSDDMEYYVENYKMIPSETEKEYTVEGLDKYASSVKDISKEMIAAMKKQAESVVTEYTAKMGSDCTVDSVAFVGDYLENCKNDNYADKQNCYGDVYKIKLHVKPSEDYKAVKMVEYYDVQFHNIVVKGNGECEADLSDYYTPGEDFSKDCYYGPEDYDYYTYYFDGFETLDDVKNARVDSVAADYDTDWNMDGGDQAEVSDQGLLCSYSTKRKITEEEIQGYLNKDYSSCHFPGDRSVIQMIINEMYALNGYKFQDEDLKNYYEKQDWYNKIESKTTDMAEIYKNMSKTEQDNIKLLKKYK